MYVLMIFYTLSASVTKITLLQDYGLPGKICKDHIVLHVPGRAPAMSSNQAEFIWVISSRYLFRREIFFSKTRDIVKTVSTEAPVHHRESPERPGLFINSNMQCLLNHTEPP